MSYLVNERDVHFTLFEYLQIQNLQSLENFSNFGETDFKAFLEQSLKFAQNELAPLNKKADEYGVRFEKGQVLTAPGFKETYQSYAQNGFIGLELPTTYGGLGLPVSLFMSISEFFTGACFSFMMFPGLTRGAGHLIEAFGTPELAQIYCPKMYGGEWTGTMCLTEPQAGSAVGDLKTTASKSGEGYLIKGSKIFISCGDNDFASNVIHLVLARIEGDPQGTKGISLFVVPRNKVNADGSVGENNDVKVVNIEHKLGIHASPTCTLAFGDQNQCVGYLVGEPRRGMPYMFQMMNEARLACGMQGLSTAGNAYEHALVYAKERVQGGKKNIIQYADVKRMLATMKAYVEGMRALLYKAGYCIDLAEHEKDAEKKAFAQAIADLLTPVCKAFCTDKGFEIATMAMQVYGGYGYCNEYPIEQMLRDVKIGSIYEGTNGIQALDLIGRKMTQNGGELLRNLYAHVSEFIEKNISHASLGKEIEALKKAMDQVGAAAMKFGEKAMGGDIEFPQLHATAFLNMMAHAVLAWLLLDQSLVALPKLEKIWADAGATDEEKKNALCENNPEARFYEGKVKTTRFFIWNLLPQLGAFAKVIQNEDPSALKMRF
ncbi:MAG: acyl-CoA dehydrogenase [Deltaproteobacteria bacterium]|nr:acyl-CoA dehydrogenase [Deltaproteobacteria bacterium]